MLPNTQKDMGEDEEEEKEEEEDDVVVVSEEYEEEEEEAEPSEEEDGFFVSSEDEELDDVPIKQIKGRGKRPRAVAPGGEEDSELQLALALSMQGGSPAVLGAIPPGRPTLPPSEGQEAPLSTAAAAVSTPAGGGGRGSELPSAKRQRRKPKKKSSVWSQHAAPTDEELDVLIGE